MTISHLFDRSPSTLLAGMALATLLGGVIALGQWVVLIALLVVCAVMFTLLYFEVSILIVCLAALVQIPLVSIEIPLVSIGPASKLDLIEMMVPLLLATLALRATRPGSGVITLGKVASKPVAVSIINLSLVAFSGVLVLNLVRALTSSSVVPGIGAVRVFYDYSVALGVYVLVYYALVRRVVTIDHLFTVLLVASLIVSILGLVIVLLSLPLFLGDLRYSVSDYSSGAVRVGFLEPFGIIGIALVLVRSGRWRLVYGAVFAAALLSSGGRSAVLGTLIAVVVYLVLTRRGLRFALAAAAATLIVWAFPVVQSSPQVERVSNVSDASFATARSFIYEESAKSFVKHPVFGTGIGQPVVVFNRDPEVARFYEAQLEVGGHATYAALLKNFGLLGLLSFAAALIAALVGLATRVQIDDRAAVFFIFLLAESITLITSGNGSDPVYYLALAGGSAVMSLSRRGSSGFSPAP